MTEIINNSLIEIKKFFIGIKELVVKLITMFIAMLFVLDGPDNSNISQSFPIGSCFHPRTLIKLKNGELYQMQDLPLGAEFEDGGKVFAILKVDNHKGEPLYRVKNSAKTFTSTDEKAQTNGIINPSDFMRRMRIKSTNDISKFIYVTGEHFIFDSDKDDWVQVKDYKDAELQHDITCDWFSCLITTNHRIKIGEHVFWDWEDDILHLKNKTIK